MRTSMNTTELLIWSRLRGRKVDGWKFRRQQPIGPYFVDFYCPAAKLIVEIDGPAHQGDATWAYDLRRQAWLETEGHRMLRISVSQISRDLNEVIETIYVVLLEQEKRGFTCVALNLAPKRCGQTREGPLDHHHPLLVRRQLIALGRHHHRLHAGQA